MKAKDYTNAYSTRMSELCSGLVVDREPVYGTKKQNERIAAEIKVEELECKYFELKSFLSEEAKELRYEINRLRRV